jgi:hypothetical protein
MTSAALAGMSDSQAQAPEIRRRQARLNVFQAIVPAVAAALLEADAARFEVEVVMDDQGFVGGDLVEARQRSDRLAGEIHEGHRLQQPQFVDASDAAKEFPLRRQRCLQANAQLVDEPEADIVPVVFVLAAGVAEADNQAGWGHDIDGTVNVKVADATHVLPSRKNGRERGRTEMTTGCRDRKKPPGQRVPDGGLGLAGVPGWSYSSLPPSPSR